MMENDISVQYLGRKKFQDMEVQQRELVSQVRGSNKILVLGLEFEPLITLGIRAESACEIIQHMNPKFTNLPFVKTDRGGFATIHSPGQLIIYPMIDLKYYNLGIKKFIDILFNSTREVLTVFGVHSEFDEKRPGLYTSNGKIAFVGIKVDQGVIRHGISINIANDLELFQAIKSCGVRCQSHDNILSYVSQQHQPNQQKQLNLGFSLGLDKASVGDSSSRQELLMAFFSKWTDRFKINLDFELSKE